VTTFERLPLKHLRVFLDLTEIAQGNLLLIEVGEHTSNRYAGALYADQRKCSVRFYTVQRARLGNLFVG
jgi:hypothetical protein